MSGHSKWAKIKRQKGVKDAKRGNLFTKLAKNITLAAKEGGGDISMNFTLRLAVDKAKVANMPSDNIARAIDRGSGKGADAIVYHRISYEALGPAGTSLVIDCQTDNTNRTVADIKNIIETGGGKFASTGSVSWQFTEKGLIIIELTKIMPSGQFGKGEDRTTVDLDDATMEVMEIEGVEDINDITWDTGEEPKNALEIVTKKENFSSVLKAIEGLAYGVLSAELVKIPNEKVSVNDVDTEEKITKFVESIEEHDDVDSVWVNI